jgi:ribosomal-protein-serine acetyltransferase
MLTVEDVTPTFRLRDGLELYPLTMRFDAELFSLVDNHRESLRRWQNWPDQIMQLENMQQLIKRSEQKVADRNGFDWVLVQDGQAAGKVGMLYIDDRTKQTELGYWLAPPFQGRGLMTRSCHRVVDYILSDIRLRSIHVRCAEGNLASRAIPHRLGFLDTGRSNFPAIIHGTAHYEVVYVMNAEDWQRRMIYHITSRDAYEAARAKGIYRTLSLQQEGFIHLSANHDQVERVANAIYRGQDGLVILVVDPALLRSELRYEPPDTSIPAEHNTGELFPHLYGPLNLDAVVDVVAFPANSDGTFALPPTLS